MCWGESSADGRTFSCSLILLCLYPGRCEKYGLCSLALCIRDASNEFNEVGAREGEIYSAGGFHGRGWHWQTWEMEEIRLD